MKFGFFRLLVRPLNMTNLLTLHKKFVTDLSTELVKDLDAEALEKSDRSVEIHALMLALVKSLLDLCGLDDDFINVFGSLGDHNAVIHVGHAYHLFSNEQTWIDVNLRFKSNRF